MYVYSLEVYIKSVLVKFLMGMLLYSFLICYRGLQLLSESLEPIFVNLLGRFYPPYMPGGSF